MKDEIHDKKYITMEKELKTRIAFLESELTKAKADIIIMDLSDKLELHNKMTLIINKLQ